MQVASRLVELNLQIRSVFRGPLPSSGEQPQNSDSEADISKPVRNSGAFAEPAATQPRPRVAVEPAKEPVSPPAPPIEIAHQPVELQDLEEGVPDEEMEPDETPLGFSQMPSELFKQGLGTDNAMIFQDKLFQERMLVQKKCIYSMAWKGRRFFGELADRVWSHFQQLNQRWQKS